MEDGLLRLSQLQDNEGGFSSWGGDSCEGCAQVVTALCTLGISLEDSRFVKNGQSPLDRLMTFREADGSFRHSQDGSDQMASEQALCALTAALRAERGESGLYDIAAPDPAMEESQDLLREALAQALRALLKAVRPS